jgi:Ca2+-transporting ATPase
MKIAMNQKPWHTLTADQVLKECNSSWSGLKESEANKRLKDQGFNKLESKERASLWTIFFHQFVNPLVCVLIFAFILKASMGKIADASVIFLTLLFMAVIGFFQEMKAEKAIQALKKFSAHRCKVKREGKIDEILSEELVAGDVLYLETGDKVPADARIIESHELQINESMFNGESLPAIKQIEPLDVDAVIADRSNMVFTGTIVNYGKGLAVVVETGMRTELGKIAESLKEIPTSQTPLQEDIHRIGYQMIRIILVIIALFILIGFWRGIYWGDLLFIAVAASVAAVPEGLPAVMTVTLATGMYNMAKKNAIIRRLIAVETLGSVTTICSDKTGTLTMNQMTAQYLYTHQKHYPIHSHKEDWDHQSLPYLTFKVGTLCSDAFFLDDDEIVGDSTEAAILKAAKAIGINQQQLAQSHYRIHEIPFTSERLYMATLNAESDRRVISVKGAPEKILPFCSHVQTEQGVVAFDHALKKSFEKTLEENTASGLRMLAIGYLNVGSDCNTIEEATFFGRLILLGIIGISDPPRDEAIEAVKKCKKAGIRVVMITGDNPLTAKAIAKAVGIKEDRVLTGKDLLNMTEDALYHEVMDVAIFARVEPIQKLKIVQALKKHSQVVAMTGDGVNDAPALEAADIGIAMGKNGTDVAKEAAEMILADDRFDTIVHAVEEGRAIFNRIRNVCCFLLSTALGELFALILSVTFMGSSALTPLQIIWINLVTGSLIAIPMGFEPKSGHEMELAPREKGAKIINRKVKFTIAFLSCMLGFSAFTMYYFFNGHELKQQSHAMVLTTIVAFEWLIAFHMRSDPKPITWKTAFNNKFLLINIAIAVALHLTIIYQPFMQTVFRIQALSIAEWGICLIPALAIFTIENCRKWWEHKRALKKNTP